ncbi:MAG: type IV pilus assembly protein PilM [Desulfomicrobium sp.]|nr:type IV pilus assembly protein PilM [Desulfomicrobium sp.]
MKRLSFFGKKNTGAGLDLGSEWMKVVTVRPGKGGCVLESLARCPWQPSDLDNNSATAKKIVNLWSHLDIKDKKVVSSLAGHAVIVKRVSFEADSNQALKDIVLKEARQYIPFDMNDVYLDYQVLESEQKNNKYDVLLVASKKKVVQNLGDIIMQSGLSLSIVDVDSFALCNSFEFNYPEIEDSPVYLLDIGSTQSAFCIFHNAQPIFLREVSFGGRDLTEAIAKSLNIKRIEAERIKINGQEDEGVVHNTVTAEIIAKTLKSWCDEIKRLIGFYQASSVSNVSGKALYLSGGSVLMPGLRELFQRELNLDVHYHNAFRKVHIDDNKFEPKYIHEIAPQMAVSFGLALRFLDKN